MNFGPIPEHCPSNLLPKTENLKPKTALQILGLYTAWCPGPGGPGFYLGEAGRRRLAQELARLDPAAPLLVLSHAPLGLVFRPWHQWTGDAREILDLLSRFSRVLLVHGHCHASSCQPSAVSCQQLQDNNWQSKGGSNGSWVSGLIEETKNVKRKTKNSHLSLPATAWPLPSPLLGTPARLRPGLGTHGCGWSLASLRGGALEVSHRLWQT
jgi:hypothetical protein